MQRDGGPGGPGGAGGAGNPVGSTFTGPSEALEILGNHIYGYSGVVAVDNVETNLINYNSGNFYIVGTFQPSIHEDTSDNMFFKIYIAGAEVSATLIGSTTSGTPFEETELILPAYTNLTITCENDSTSNARDVTAVFTGRIYRG